MTFTRLVLKDIARNEFRSWMVFLSAMLVSALVLVTGLVLQGTGDSLRLTQGRLGADILVVPQGSESRVESALLMGTPAGVWMPASTVGAIRDIPGVAAASPQMYLASLEGASCCSVSSMFIVAFDPATDFTVQPWLEEQLGEGLGVGDAVGGAFVSVSEGDDGLKIYGYPLDLAANLEPTGANLDQSLFLTFETAREVARTSLTEAVEPLQLPDDSVSSVLVRLTDEADPDTVAGAILTGVPGTGVVMAPSMFDGFRTQLAAVRGGLVFTLGLTVVLSVLLIAVVFSMASHERRREIGVWRALGATHGHVIASLVVQAVVLAAAGGVVGVGLSALAAGLFHDAIVDSIGVPFLFPTAWALLPLLLLGLACAVVTAVLASLVPAIRVSLQDPASAMRE